MVKMPQQSLYIPGPDLSFRLQHDVSNPSLVTMGVQNRSRLTAQSSFFLDALAIRRECREKLGMSGKQWVVDFESLNLNVKNERPVFEPVDRVISDNHFLSCGCHNFLADYAALEHKM